MPLLEAPSRIEPCLLDQTSLEILDLVAELSRLSDRLGHCLHPRSAANLADLVRVMNCYYSNLIEGHNTTPREIERALENQLDDIEDRRNLQLEARAHIRLQRQIDTRPSIHRIYPIHVWRGRSPSQRQLDDRVIFGPYPLTICPVT